MKEAKQAVRICLFVLYVVDTTTQNRNHCKHTDLTTDGPLEWDGRPANLALVCNKYYMELHCCAKHYSHIAWYERENASDTWKPFRSSKQRFIDTANSYNQTLIFKEANRGVDDHEYKCVVSNTTGFTIEQIIELQIYLCPGWDGPPLMIQPIEPEITFNVLEGDPFAVECSAFFGLNVDDFLSLRLITWMKIDKNSDFDIITDNASQNIYFELLDTIEGNGLASVLHIKHVGPGDFGKYICQASNGFVQVPKRTVWIKEKAA